ncbi:MAG: HEPN domain-containing protein [Thermotogota bacterium]|nr:HEPN domain-containing protein [Thermotogota bacterium]
MGESRDYKEWVAFAKQDLDSAVYLKKMVPLPIEIICYHCHQCAEKMLKALLLKKHLYVPRTHDLMVLYNISKRRYREITHLKEECIDLTDYSVSARYPYNIELEDYDALNAIESAREIYDTVQIIQ